MPWAYSKARAIIRPWRLREMFSVLINLAGDGGLIRDGSGSILALLKMRINISYYPIFLKIGRIFG